jgi:hypothetical protein
MCGMVNRSKLENPKEVLSELTIYLAAARQSLTAGRAYPGPDTWDTYNELAFALPANPAGSYRLRKEAPIAEALGNAAKVWEAQ